MIVVGDIHGMKDSLECASLPLCVIWAVSSVKPPSFAIDAYHLLASIYSYLLKKIKYKPHKDTLIHTGDALTKGTNPSQTLEFLAANNITGEFSAYSDL